MDKLYIYIQTFVKMDSQQNKYYLFIDSLRNKHGLVPTSNILYEKINDHYELSLKKYPKINVYPHWMITDVVRILLREEILWKNCSIDIKIHPPMVARAPVFGVPLGKAIDEALKKGLQKSLFTFNEPPQNGLPANLLLFVGLNKKESITTRELQVWEGVPYSKEVFYAHAIFSADTANVNHFDCASMILTDSEFHILFNQGKKIKGSEYNKHFLIECILPLDKAISLMKAYFPIEELANEALSLQKL